MDGFETRLVDSLQRLGIACSDKTVADLEWIGPDARLSSATQFVSICASRMGRDAKRRRIICRRLSRLMLDCRASGRNEVLVVASGSAIDSWATRAALLFSVSLLRVSFREKAVRGTSIKDQAVVHAGDRVEAIYVRRKGAIAKAIEARLLAGTGATATTRVCVTGLDDCDAARLIQLGAVGRWLPPTLDTSAEHSVAPVVKRSAIEQSMLKQENVSPGHWPTDRWHEDSGRWLIHCTRASVEESPGQSSSRWMDTTLLTADEPNRQTDTPLASLRRILTSQRLIASAKASSHAHPVVCLSAIPLLELLSRRTYRSHLGRWDYEPFGIAIRLDAAQAAGACPVIYGSKEDRSRLSPDQKFRFQATGSTYDWTAEREYRSPNSLDLTQFALADVRVFVQNRSDRRQIQSLCPWAITVVSDILSEPETSIPNETAP